MKVSKKDFLKSRGLKENKLVNRYIYKTLFGYYNIAKVVGKHVFIYLYDNVNKPNEDANQTYKITK